MQSCSIPRKYITEFPMFTTKIIASDFKKSLNKDVLPQSSKISEVILVDQRDQQNDKNTCRPISIFSNGSQIYECYMYYEIGNWIITPR